MANKGLRWFAIDSVADPYTMTGKVQGGMTNMADIAFLIVSFRVISQKRISGLTYDVTVHDALRV